MAKDKSKKQKGTKRLGNASTRNQAVSSAGRGRGNRSKRGKGPTNNAEARSNTRRQQSRGRSRQGNPSPLIRRQLGAGIRDARQIINSHQRGKSRRAIGGRSQTFTNSNLANGLPQMSSAAFNDAVRAAIAPIVAPLLRGTVGAAASARVSHSQSAAPPGNGPCCLRVANLAQSVSANDLADLFGGYSGFTTSEMEGPGIALVAFQRRDSAMSALEEYNNRELDGRTMMIQMDSSGGHSTTSRLGPKPSHAASYHATQPARSISTSTSGILGRQSRADQRWNEIRSTCDL